MGGGSLLGNLLLSLLARLLGGLLGGSLLDLLGSSSLLGDLLGSGVSSSNLASYRIINISDLKFRNYEFSRSLL